MKTPKSILVSVIAVMLVLHCSPAIAQGGGLGGGGPGGGGDPPTDAFELYGDLTTRSKCRDTVEIGESGTFRAIHQDE